MLDELIVENLGIIERAHIEPGTGLIVVSGETGAGKTMLLGALRLLIGSSGRREIVGPFGEQSTVDGRFLLDDEEMTLRRRVTSEGRSKAYSDGSMVPARALQERTRGYVEIVGQHDHMLLTSPGGARLLVDGALSKAGEKAAASYSAAWQRLVETRQAIELLGGGRHELERELEVLRFQADEIAAGGFEAGEDVELKKRAARLRNREDLVAGFGSVLAELGEDGAAGRLVAAAAEIRQLVRIDDTIDDFQVRLDEIVEGLGELQVDLASVAAGLEHDPGALEGLETRIHLLGELRRKYGDSLDEILLFAAAAEQRAAELTKLLSRAEDLSTELADRLEAAKAEAARLTAERRKAARRLEKAATTHLRDLGMTDPVVNLAVAKTDLGPSGADRIELGFASDSGLSAGPAAKIASGGELSRLTLALRLAGGIGDAAVIAFDEIDAGIGGATAREMGSKLAALSVGRQVLCVTHLPQVAAHADAHYVVERTGSAARVRLLSGDDRLAELSRMLGGLPDSERGQLHAAELLAAARQT